MPLQLFNVTEFPSMASMMEAIAGEDVENTISLPQIFEINAVRQAPFDFIRILETGGILLVGGLLDSWTMDNCPVNILTI